jgi:hypothetical protein
MTIITGAEPYRCLLCQNRAPPDVLLDFAVATTEKAPMQQSARQNEPQPNRPQRQPRPAGPAGALVPQRVASIPIEPPSPKEVADRLEYRNAAQYKKAVATAERFLAQARMAVDRRTASISKQERQATLDHEETVHNYQRQVAAAQSRYKQLIEQANSRHRQGLFQARVALNQAEDVYKEALRGIVGYGELQLQVMALNDARAVTHSLVSAYKSALGPDGLGDLGLFLSNLDKMIDLARDRGTVVPLQFADALVKAVVSRHVRRAGENKAEAERLKQMATARLTSIQGFMLEKPKDQTPQDVRAVYLAVHDWLSKAAGTPFDLALDRLKLDVEATARREATRLQPLIEAAAAQCNHLHLIQPVAAAYHQAQRVFTRSEVAARNGLQGELARIEGQLEKEIQMADAMVVGMDHTAAKRLAEAKRGYAEARRLVSRWSKTIDDLEEEVSGWQRMMWRFTEGFDHQQFWDEFRLKSASAT